MKIAGVREYNLYRGFAFVCQITLNVQPSRIDLNIRHAKSNALYLPQSHYFICREYSKRCGFNTENRFSLWGGANCSNRLQQIPLGVGTLMRASVTMFCSRWWFLFQGRVRSVSFKVDPTDFCSVCCSCLHFLTTRQSPSEPDLATHNCVLVS